MTAVMPNLIATVAADLGKKSKEQALEELRIQGFTLLPNMIPQDELVETRQHLDALLQKDINDYGKEELLKIRELGTLRFMLAHDPYFIEFANRRSVMELVESVLGDTCILHLQNGIVLVPSEKHQQGAYHQDFRLWLNGYDVSLNTFCLIDDFTVENGGTIVVPGTHMLEERPSDEYLQRNQIQINGPAGTIMLFNSRLWHRGGDNRTTQPRRAINMQYTRAFIRQQVDYANTLPEEDYTKLPERTQQILGRFVRLPKSLAEFRVPADKRLHRSGQY